jgi:histidinol-phosphate aminotransferase
MNKQISRRNLIKLLGISGASIPLTGLINSKEINLNKNSKENIPIKLSSNENPHGPSEKVRNAIVSAFDEVCRYPYSEPYNRISQLEKKIAKREGVDPGMVLVTGGSNEGLRATGRLFGIEKKEIIACKPTYLALMTYAKEFDCKINWVPLDKELKYDLNEMKNRVSDKTSMIFVCNPNNPTGTMLDSNALENFCLNISKKTCVFVDEAYYDYSINDGYPTMTKLVKKGHNIIVSRTFSKVYGLAGLRIGYLISNKERISQLKKCTMAGTNILASHAAINAYDDIEFFNYSLNKNNEGLNFLYSLFEDLDLEYKKSYTNFVFFKSGHHIDKVQDFMKKKNILVGRAFPPYYNWCRISTGKMEDLEKFSIALKDFYKT